MTIHPNKLDTIAIVENIQSLHGIVTIGNYQSKSKEECIVAYY